MVTPAPVVDEETWYAAFRAALLAPDDRRVPELLAAWELRPERLEPLACAVGFLNRAGLPNVAYALIPPTWPEAAPEGLFVADDPWRYGMAYERSVAAFGTGRYVECARLSADLAARDDVPEPVREAARHNLALVTEGALAGRPPRATDSGQEAA